MQNLLGVHGLTAKPKSARELRNRWSNFAIALAEAVGWIPLPPGLGFRPVPSFARALETFDTNAKGPRALRIKRLLAADQNSALDLGGQVTSVRAALGALLGPDGGPVAIEPFLELVGAVSRHMATEGTTRAQRHPLHALVEAALGQIREVTRIDAGEEVWREQGRCLGCGGRLLTWSEGTPDRRSERGKRHFKKTGRALVRRERAEYCCDLCKRANQRARLRRKKRGR